MPLPFLIAAPAVAASLAYLNARTQFAHDRKLISSIIRATLSNAMRERRDRVNFFYALEEQALSKTNGDKTFLIYQDSSWTYKQTYELAIKYGNWFKTTYDIKPGEIVAMDFMNSPKFIFMMWGLWSIGATPAFLNYNLTSKPLLHCVKTSSARYLFVDDEVKASITPEVVEALSSDTFRDDGGAVEIIYVDAALEGLIAKINPERPPDKLRAGVNMYAPNSICCLIYTSGTTGMPKPAILQWFRCYSAGSFQQVWMGLRKNDIYYTCMPLYHSTAFVLCLFPCLVAGCTIALGHKFSNKTFWPEVRESNATVIQYVGETCRYLLAAPPQLDPVTGEDLDKKNKVRTAFGNGLRPDVWEKFKERFGVETIAEFYSATEGPSASFNLSSNTFATGAIGRFGTVAKLLTGSKMAIVALDWEAETPHRDPKNNNFCTRVPVGHQGELIYALDANDIKSKFQGYFKNEKATESKILRNVFTKGDAWFRTGDVMKLDEEGRMWFCDRIGDTFRWRSENVSTNEVSEVLGNHPSVDEANVYGVEVPKHDGRAGCVAITFNTDPTPALLKSIAEHTIKRLPKYAVPLFLRITKVVRTTGNNKQQKHVLRNEGIDLAKVDRGDSMFWLKDGTYVPFQEEDLSSIKAGQVRL